MADMDTFLKYYGDASHFRKSVIESREVFYSRLGIILQNLHQIMSPIDELYLMRRTREFGEDGRKLKETRYNISNGILYERLVDVESTIPKILEHKEIGIIGKSDAHSFMLNLSLDELVSVAHELEKFISDKLTNPNLIIFKKSRE